MLISSFRSFLDDESGGYTVWSLLWFSIYIAMGGLAVDMSDAYRTKTMLQSTADASALAAVMELPNKSAGTAQAVKYSKDNMLQNINGTVLRDSDVTFGTWTIASRTFTPSDASNGNFDKPDAAMVVTKRAEDNENPLATNFLRIIGLMDWDVNTAAIAIKYIPSCIRGGLVAKNRVDTNSGNAYVNLICIHGQNYVADKGQDCAVEVQNNSTFQDGVKVTMPDKDDLCRQPQVYGNEGLEKSHEYGSVLPADVGKLPDIMRGLVDFSKPVNENPYMPDYITAGAVTEIDNTWKDKSGNLVTPSPGNVYHVTSCKGANDLVLPVAGGTLKEMVFISECSGISAASGLVVEDVVIASKKTANGADPLNVNGVNLASSASLGNANFCENGGKGGVEVYAYAGAHVAATAFARGIRAVVGGTLQLTAGNDILGISAQAGVDIKHTSGSTIGLCPQGTLPPGEYTWHYRLVY